MLVFGAASPTVAQSVSAATPVATASRQPPSDAEIRRMLAIRVDVQRRSTGMVLGLTTPAGHRLVAYGKRGLDDPRPVDGRTVYDIGSLTKVFTALLLAQDVE